jgi:hypothetical protein
MEIQKSQIHVRFWEEQTGISKPVNMLPTSYDKKGQVVSYAIKSLQAEIFHHAFNIKHYQVLYRAHIPIPRKPNFTWFLYIAEHAKGGIINLTDSTETRQKIASKPSQTKLLFKILLTKPSWWLWTRSIFVGHVT